jgi:hypothetical protein
MEWHKKSLKAEPVFVNVYGAHESIPWNRFRQAKDRYLVSLKDLQIRAQGISSTSPLKFFSKVNLTNVALSPELIFSSLSLLYLA